MKFGYYPGCSLHATAVEYGDSFEKVCHELGIDLKEVEDWVCCGTMPSHATSKLIALALPVFNLILAKKENLETLLVPCSSCYSRFKTAILELKEDVELRKKVEYVLESVFTDEVLVKHPLEIISDNIFIEKIKGRIKNSLKGMKIACYYGCLLTRPPEITGFDSVEYPMSMDRILKMLGAETIDWSYKTECCGASLSLTRDDIVKKLCCDILENAKASGADAVAAACPLCQSNLDLWQGKIEKEYEKQFSIPIFYFTQLLGIALGIPENELGLSKLMVSPYKILEQNGII